MNEQTFLTLEESLSLRLLDTWQPIKGRIIVSLVQAIELDDYEAVNAVVARIKLERSTEGNYDYIKQIGRGAVLFGSSRLTDGEPDDTQALEEPGTKSTVARSSSQVSMVLKDASIKVRRAVEQQAFEELENRRIGKIQKDITTLAEGLGGKFASGESSINLASSLHTSRLSSYGYCVEATLLQVVTCTNNEALDSRTCPVCEFMDQTVLSVEKIFTQVKKAFEATTVEELKRTAPWPGQSKAALTELTSMTTNEIQELGYYPPFHPLCRGFLDFNTSGQQVVDTVTTPSNIPGMGNITPPTLAQSEQRIRNSVIPRTGHVSLDGINDSSVAAQIAETLVQNVQKYGKQVQNVQTVSRGKFLTRMDYDATDKRFTLNVNKTALNKLGDKTAVDAVYASGAEDGVMLARNLDEAITHDYGVRSVTVKAQATGDLSVSYPGVSQLADEGLIESGGELFLKRAVSTLNVDETAFLEALL
jgi:hypothetical protein